MKNYRTIVFCCCICTCDLGLLLFLGFGSLLMLQTQKTTTETDFRYESKYVFQTTAKSPYTPWKYHKTMDHAQIFDLHLPMQIPWYVPVGCVLLTSLLVKYIYFAQMFNNSGTGAEFNLKKMQCAKGFHLIRIAVHWASL